MKKLTIIILSISCSFIFAQNKTAKIEELMNAVFNNGNFSGSVCVTENGKQIYSKGLGFADIDTQKPVTGDTKFGIASISKQITAALIMKLAENGKLKFTDKLSKYIKEYPEESGNKVTLHHMLTNTSGIPDVAGIMLKPYTHNDLLNIVKNIPLEFKPGSKLKWSNSSWEMLGIIIEKVTGKEYEQVLNEEFIVPLNLKGTTIFQSDKKIKDQAAQGYVYKSGVYVPTPEYCFKSLAAADGIISTAEELAMYGDAIIYGKLFTEESMRIMFTPYIDSGNKNYKLGYGWQVGEGEFGTVKVPLKYMAGGMQGYLSMYINVDNKYSVALVSNYSNAPMALIRDAIINILLDQKYVIPKSPISPVLNRELKSAGLTAMMAQLKKINETEKDRYQTDENAINQFAYELLNSGFIDESIAVFKYIIELNPESWNAYDSAAEALTKKGNIKEAIENYERSLILNPSNTNGKEMLNKLKERIK